MLLLALRVLATMLQAIPGRGRSATMAQTYGVIFQLFFVRLVVFFGCFGIFTYLVRGEMLERSLHFYFLAPLRRDVFVVGKYLAGVRRGRRAVRAPRSSCSSRSASCPARPRAAGPTCSAAPAAARRWPTSA